MKDNHKTKQQLVDELGLLRQRVATLEAAETDRKQVEGALRRNEQRFMQFFENGPEYCYMVSPDGIVLDVNRAALKALGYRKNELVGKPLQTVYAPELLPKMKRLFRKWHETGALKDEEMVVITRKGERRTVLLSAGAVTDKDGKVLHSVSIQKDVTERVRMERALAESEERYRLLVENANEAIVVAQDEGLKFANPQASQLMGYSREELTSRPFLEFIHPDDRQMVEERHLMRLAGEELPHVYPFRIIHREGDTKWAEINAVRIDWEGRPATLNLLTDITERKQAEEALRESEEKYRDLTENINDVIYAVDRDGTVTYISPVVEQVLGYRSSEIVGRSFGEFMYQEDMPPAMESFLRVLSGDSTADEYRLRAKSGELRWLRTSNRPIFDGNRVVGARGVLTDVTDRKQADQALRRSEERYRTILEEMEEGYHELDLAGNFTFVNDSMCRMLGYSKEELMGMNYRTYTPAEDVKAIFQEYNRVYRTGEPLKSLSYRTIRKDGSTALAEVSVLPVRNQEGEIVGFRGIRRDVTERKQAEQALCASEERYRTLFESKLDGVCVIDEAMKTLLANQTAADMFGFDSVQELCEANLFDYIAPEERERALTIIAKDMFENDLRQVNEFRCLKKSGEEMWVGAVGTVIDYQGKTAGLASFRDVTERKQAEQALRDSEGRLRAVLDAMAEGVVVIAPDGQIVRANPAAERILGLQRSEIEARNYVAPEWEILRPDGTLMPADEMAGPRAMKERRLVKDVEMGVRRPDGSVCWINVSAALLLEETGHLQGVVGTFVDVTNRKQAEEALRQSEERYRTILDNMEGGYFEVDIAGNFTFVNDALCRHLGYSREEMIGMNNRAYMDEENAEQVHKTFNEVYRSGKPAKWFSWELIRKNGERRFVEASVYPLSNEAGENIGFRGISNDITERKQAEEERRELEQKAHLASRLASVGEMASGIAHEINNPLTAVIGYSQLLMAKDLPEDIRGDIGAIHDGSQRVAGVVKRLLAFARQQRLEREYVNINEIIETTLALRTYEMETGNVKVKAYLDPMLPATIADGAQLQQVFLNLIINAETEMRLAHGKGNLLVKTEAIDNTIRISFEDDGPGIASENLQRIFEPFFTTREVGEGTGLGLSVCHGIVSEHGGTIHVESQLRKGATFIVELPIVTESEQLKLAEPEAEEPRRVAGAKILAVDDEPLILQLVRQVLTREGYEVETVDNATEALERIKGQRYSLILLDIKMPGMSGTELYRRIQRMARPLARRVLFITGDVIGASTTAFFARTKAPHISKPFDGAQLKREVNRMLAENP